MRKYSLKPSLRRILKKLSKKDRVAYEQILKKIQEIISCKQVDHYKNLRKPLQDYKRVHVKSSFVLIFKYTKEKNEIEFCDFAYHDSVYR